jgi:hypothetical protein
MLVYLLLLLSAVDSVEQIKGHELAVTLFFTKRSNDPFG